MAILNKQPINGEAANALSATRYTAWMDVRALEDVGFAIHTVGTGSPVGTFSFEGSNDGDLIKYEQLNGIAPASSAAKKVTLTAGTVHGSALAITGSSASDTFVSFSGGLPRFVRVKFTYTSGGSASSLWYCLVSGRGTL